MNKLIFVIIAAIVLSMTATQSASAMSDEERYQSGFDHGCSDSHIWDSSERYINQPGKGFSHHTDSFNQGYHDGYKECGYDGGVLSSETNTNTAFDNSFNNRDSVVQPQNQQAFTSQSAGCPSQIINGDCIVGQEQKTHNEFAQANRADN